LHIAYHPAPIYLNPLLKGNEVMPDFTKTRLNRREFLGAASLAGIGLVFAGAAPSVRGAAEPASPNETVRVAIIGTGDRGLALTRGFSAAPNCQVAWVCDVDEKRLAKAVETVEKKTGKAPAGVKDFRTILDNPDLDAVVIATPSHWHTAAAILALKAGKHVYVEKPASHDGHEADLLAQAQEKYGKLVQMGNQQRSHPETIEAIQRIRDGVIGRAYQVRGWIASARESIGHGKPAPVPAGLDYELWQGPAPRTPYKDNVIHYNWHWFRHWGGGELANNGTHEIDVARWVLGVDYPEQVGFSGGRYHFDDDWEFADTQDVTWDFPGEKSIVWQGRSCNAMPVYDRGRGIAVHGTEGTIIMDRDGYVLYDLKGKQLEAHPSPKDPEARGRGIDQMTFLHINNFLDAVRTGTKLNSPISEAR
jgi:predicted dehydrogenase